jgi:hypothetical protein
VLRYRLRTLLIVLALGPVAAWAGWRFGAWQAERIAEHEAQQRAMRDFVPAPLAKQYYEGSPPQYPPQSAIDALKCDPPLQ